MGKQEKVIWALWIILAIGSIVGAFYAPLWVSIINWLFGTMNIFIILAVAGNWVKEIKEKFKDSDGVRMQEKEE